MVHTVYIGPHRTYHRSRVTGTRMANWARTLNKNYQTRKLAFRLNYIFYFIEEMSEKRKRMFTRKVFIRLVTLKSRISYYRNFKKHLEINNVYLSFTSSATNKSVKSKILWKFTLRITEEKTLDSCTATHPTETKHYVSQSQQEFEIKIDNN